MGHGSRCEHRRPPFRFFERISPIQPNDRVEKTRSAFYCLPRSLR